VVWLDADVLVFDPQNFALKAHTGAAFAREHMLGAMPDGSIRAQKPGINNAVMVFDEGNAILPFYIHACESIIGHFHPEAGLARTALGPGLLQRLATVLPLECINQVGLFTWRMMQEISAGQSRMAQLYAGCAGVPLAAANLCNHIRTGLDENSRRTMDAQYVRAIRILVESKGAVINRFIGSALERVR
jgi:hypothetical protein